MEEMELLLIVQITSFGILLLVIKLWEKETKAFSVSQILIFMSFFFLVELTLWFFQQTIDYIRPKFQIKKC